MLRDPRALTPVLYGLDRWNKLFTDRQVVALATLAELIERVRVQLALAVRRAGLKDLDTPLHLGGRGARAYVDAIVTYLALAVDKALDRNTSLCVWETAMDRMRGTFGRAALPMVWDYAETNPLGGAGGDISGTAA